jgi:N-dimethylarginine dimethylaminohydrolase
MHLDTRVTILPGRSLLIHPGAFLPDDLDILKSQFNMIEVTEAEALAMATNVFVVNPETVVLHSGFDHIAKLIESEGLKVELINYSEPNALLGSFRCATMPLARL